jgi:hypothetical protein
MKPLKFCSVVIILCLFSCFPSFAASVPPISDLTATQGPAPGQVNLFWHVPLFDNPDTSQSYDYSCEFRTSSSTINASNWSFASPVQGSFDPSIGYQIVGPTITLEIAVTGYDDGVNYHWDEADLRAWLSVQYSNSLFCSGISGEHIDFNVFPSANNPNPVYSGWANTDNVGMAEVVTWDLYNGPPTDSPNKFHFVAYWKGHSISLYQGRVVVGSGNLTDSYDMYLSDMTTLPPVPGTWSSGGGRDGFGWAGFGFEFDYPASAVPVETYVTISTPYSVPGVLGMKPGVNSIMTAVQLDASGLQEFDKPILITVTYPPESLHDSNGCMGESSLRAYHYDTNEYKWKIIDSSPAKIDRVNHTIGFKTSQTGMFAVAAERDDDCDGLGNYEEYHYGTSPKLADSDGDGISDGNEIWFTHGNPLDSQKLYGYQQHGLVTGLNTGQGYYIAARIIGPGGQSVVSDNVYVANTCPVNVDLNCDKTVSFFDLAVLANNWLETIP